MKIWHQAISCQKTGLWLANLLVNQSQSSLLAENILTSYFHLKSKPTRYAFSMYSILFQKCRFFFQISVHCDLEYKIIILQLGKLEHILQIVPYHMRLQSNLLLHKFSFGFSKLVKLPTAFDYFPRHCLIWKGK